LEIVVIWLVIFGKVKYFPRLKGPGMIQMNRSTMVIGSIPSFIKTSGSSRHRLDFSTLGLERGGYFVFGEDCFVRAFGDAGAAVDACVWVDVIPRPFFHWLARHDALNRADIYTSGVPQAKTSDNVCHGFLLNKIGAVMITRK
jgi:hypothetical protein